MMGPIVCYDSLLKLIIECVKPTVWVGQTGEGRERIEYIICQILKDMVMKSYRQLKDLNFY